MQDAKPKKIKIDKTSMNDSKSAVSGAFFQPLYNLERRLDEALYSGEGYKSVPQALTDLSHYTQLHFSALGTLADPYLQLANQVREWVSEHSSGITILTGEILYFLRNWLNSHFHLSAPEPTSPS